MSREREPSIQGTCKSQYIITRGMQVVECNGSFSLPCAKLRDTPGSPKLVAPRYGQTERAELIL